MLKNALYEYVLLLTSFPIICQKQTSFAYILIVIFKLWISKFLKCSFLWLEGRYNNGKRRKKSEC